MRKLLFLLVLLTVTLPALGQTPRVITTGTDPDGQACTLATPPIVLVYHTGSTVELCSCQSSLWSCSDAIAAAAAPAFSAITSATNTTATMTVGTGASIVASGSGAITATAVAADSVALTTDTTGNYAAGDGEAGAALTGDSATSFFSSGTLEDARLPSSMATKTFTGVTTVSPGATGDLCVFNDGSIICDLDDDGNVDTAWVGDYDADGTLEMQDVDDILDTLCPSDVCAGGGLRLYLTAGTYTAPTAPEAGNVIALIDLPSNIVFDCGNAVLTGLDESVAPANEWAAIGTDGTTDVVVQNCEIDGNMPATYDFDSVNAGSRMGIHIKDATRVLVQNVYSHHTRHSCFYVKDSTDVTFDRVNGENCGGYGDTAPTTPLGDGYPCFYGFTSGTTTLERVRFTNSTCKNSLADAVNFRRNTTAGTIKDVFVSNVMVDGLSDVSKACFNANGVQGGQYIGNQCRGGRGFSAANASGYWDGTPHVDSSFNILIDGLTVDLSGADMGLFIGDYHDTYMVRNLTVIGDSTAGQDCANFRDPIRHLTIDGFFCSDVGDDGIVMQEAIGAGGADESFVFRNVRFDSLGDRYISSATAVTGMILDGFHFTGYSGSNGLIRITAAVNDSQFRNGLVDNNGTGTGPAFWFSTAANRTQFANLTFSGIEGNDGIRFVSVDCVDCVFTNITAHQGGASTTNSALDLDSDPTSASITSVVCGTVASPCVDTAGLGTDEECQWNNGVKTCKGTSTTATCNQGDLYHDTDGDGTTNCSGGECTLFLCTATDTWSAVR